MENICQNCAKLNGVFCPNKGLRVPKYNGCSLYIEKVHLNDIDENESTTTFNENIDVGKRLDNTHKISTDKSIREVMETITLGAYKRMSVTLAIKCLLNEINKHNMKDSEVNWNRFNEIIHNCWDYNSCFNIIDPEFHSINEVEVYVTQDMMSTCEPRYLPYRKCKCKDCKKEFTMTLNEVCFFLDKRLQLPKRCKECRIKKRHE